MTAAGFARSAVVFVGLSLSATAGEQILVWDKSTPEVFRRAVIISEAEFHPDTLAAVARRTLDDYRGKKFIQHQIFSDERQANPYPRMGDLGFEGWLHFYRILAAVRWRVAELIAFDGKAVLRTRDGDSITRVVLERGDPLIRQIGDVSFEILHVDFPRYFGPCVFARSEGATKAAAKGLLEELRQVLHPKVDRLEVRNDHWFVLHEDFPIYYWFRVDRPPSMTEWNRGQFISCGRWRGKEVQCEGNAPE